MAESVLARLIRRHGAGFTIVHGGATGIDKSFAEACAELDIPQEVHPARWEALDMPGALIRQGKAGRPYVANAGPIRNQEMVDAGADLCIAFHRELETSRGTLDMVRRALAAGVPTYICSDETATPVRIKRG